MIWPNKLVSLFMGVTHAERRLASVPSSERKEVVLMSDYELLIVILTIITTILIEYISFLAEDLGACFVIVPPYQFVIRPVYI